MSMQIVRGVLVLLTILFLPLKSVAIEDLTWKVVNRFPVFRNDADFEAIDAKKTPGESISTYLFKLNPEELRKVLPIRATYWEPKTGTYSKELFNPYHQTRFSYFSAITPSTCTWILNGKEQSGSRCDGIDVAIKEKTPFSMELYSSGKKLTSVTGEITVELIVGLGDSFASGEGNPDHPVTYSHNPQKDSLRNPNWFQESSKGHGRFAQSAQWWDQACHRSLLSWQGLFALNRALSDDQRVVQYASFACSGAEIYDGFFRAQLAPPGSNITHPEKSVENLNTGKERDGGNGHFWTPTPGDVGNSYPKNNEASEPSVRKSQLNAAMQLLCEGQIDSQNSVVQFHTPASPLRFSVFYGEFKYKKCAGTIRQPEFLLVSFGGNDFGFGGVVIGAMAPENARSSFNLLGRIGLDLVRRQQLGVVAPELAKQAIINSLGTLYHDLDHGIGKLLGIAPSAQVHMLVYPDPLPKDHFAECSDRLSAGNEALGQLAYRQGNIFTRGWPFTVEQTNAIQVRAQFISTLQTYQRQEIEKYPSWSPLESQRGFESKAGNRTFCSVAPICLSSPSSCPTSDLFGWATSAEGERPVSNKAAVLPNLQRASDWKAYDPERSRGLRTGNDAVMTQATFSSKENAGKVQDDWRSGSAHPTATVHDAIAVALEKNIASGGTPKTPRSPP